MDVKDVWFFTSKLEVSRFYLRCLIENKKLARLGYNEVHHKEPIKYYQAMLDVADGKCNFIALDDGIHDDALADHIPKALAICDRQEGEPTTSDEDIDDGIVAPANDGTATQKWKTLHGNVVSQTAKERALLIAQSVKGVSKITSKLIIIPKSD